MITIPIATSTTNRTTHIVDDFENSIGAPPTDVRQLVFHFGNGERRTVERIRRFQYGRGTKIAPLFTMAWKNWRTIRTELLAAGVVITGVSGNSLLRAGLKAAAPLVGVSPFEYLKEFTNIVVILGVIVLAASFLLQLSLLSWADLTYALPVTSASYVVVTLVGAFLLDEHVTPVHWLAVCLIVMGVIVVGRTQPLTPRRARR
jgi:multidrug transporter EmrE-like cation transporter